MRASQVPAPNSEYRQVALDIAGRVMNGRFPDETNLDELARKTLHLATVFMLYIHQGRNLPQEFLDRRRRD